MSFEAFRARLEGLGATFHDIVVTDPDGSTRTKRYFVLNGKFAVVDLGDMQQLTQGTVSRVCRQLSVDLSQVTSLPN
jgi:hypothetical protein